MSNSPSKFQCGAGPPAGSTPALGADGREEKSEIRNPKAEGSPKSKSRNWLAARTESRAKKWWVKNGETASQYLAPVGRRSCGAASQPERRHACRRGPDPYELADKNVGAPPGWQLPFRISDFGFRISDFPLPSSGSFAIKISALLLALLWLVPSHSHGRDTNLPSLPPPRPTEPGQLEAPLKSPSQHATAETNLPATSNTASIATSNALTVPRSSVLSEANMMFASTNLVHSEEEEQKASLRTAAVNDYKQKLEIARRQRAAGLYEEATPNYVAVLNSDAPDDLKQASMLELALVAQEQKNLTRGLQILSQYLTRWPNDSNVPEVLLRQGLIYRQLGIHGMAMGKFYATMTTALVLKGENFEFYRRLVLQAQAEIAETLALQNKHKEASEAFARLLKEESPALNRARVKYRYLHSLAAQGRQHEAVGQAQDFLAQNPDAPESAEVRFLLATGLKKLGRNGEALQEVLRLLRSQQGQAKEHPETLAYWQQRTGNEIANQLYQEGDFLRALDIYQSLLLLSPLPAWQCPVLYQIGLAYERLEQPTKAADAYGEIIAKESEIGTNAPPSLKAMLDMARWRRDFLKWQVRTEIAHRDLKPFLLPQPAPVPPAGVTNPTKL